MSENTSATTPDVQYVHTTLGDLESAQRRALCVSMTRRPIPAAAARRVGPWAFSPIGLGATAAIALPAVAAAFVASLPVAAIGLIVGFVVIGIPLATAAGTAAFPDAGYKSAFGALTARDARRDDEAVDLVFTTGYDPVGYVALPGCGYEWHPSPHNEQAMNTLTAIAHRVGTSPAIAYGPSATDERRQLTGPSFVGAVAPAIAAAAPAFTPVKFGKTLCEEYGDAVTERAGELGGGMVEALGDVDVAVRESDPEGVSASDARALQRMLETVKDALGVYVSLPAGTLGEVLDSGMTPTEELAETLRVAQESASDVYARSHRNKADTLSYLRRLNSSRHEKSQLDES